MWRNIASNALTLFIVGLVVLAGVIAWGRSQYSSAGPLETAICLQVPAGGNMRGVSSDLAEQGAITSDTIFRVGADYSDKSSLLKAGSFLVPEQSSMAEIVDIITRGGASTCGTEVVFRIGVNATQVDVRELDPATNRFRDVAEFVPGPEGEEGDAVPEEYTTVRNQNDTRYRVLVAEGTTVWRVVESLKLADFIEGDLVEMPAEGMLAPDSYEVVAGSDVGALISRMEDAQAARLEESWRNRVDDLPFETKEDALIMASIIEKETGVAEERRQVASVFENRLKQGMRLQTDPTVIYGVTNGEGVLGRGLRQSELQRETPYNTYVINGMPPTPIANPGLAAIEAALDPAQTDYIFFVADGTGGHAFATTLAEHNANVALWRKIEAEKAAAETAE
ncbi:putative aminodeoxychorismate lyase [Aquimixticola soesokkakensis]|uniref:Endolytic murein transglycosylase n=1 Tax=Aquimixticola soesokkakensis TaxID=1519096 RepID=A0A1Y5SQ90_9RHOB|nr:endolytic transglycosylase MltG [Aquimixticola soesokkakensis]SLN45917.1 putative aminodeoxychorismate lyase [Aquimixticola soesokkakensis]